MAFSPVAHTTIPRDDGSHANDWVTNPWHMWTSGVGQHDYPAGARRSFALELRIQVASGSGVNSWTVQPVQVVNDGVPSDGRRWMPDDRACAVGICPVTFAETDLPLQRIYTVQLRLGSYALHFARTGAGTNVLRVRFYVQV